MESGYKKLMESVIDASFFSWDEQTKLLNVINERLKGVKDVEERSKFMFWFYFDYIFNDAVDDVGTQSLERSFGRLCEIVHIIEVEMDDNLLKDAVEHLKALKKLDWLLMHHDSEHYGTVALSLMKFYRKFTEKVVFKEKKD